MRKKFQNAILVDTNKLMRIEEPGKAHDFGIPVSILNDIGARYSAGVFLGEKGLDPSKFGQEGMEALIKAVKGAGDRTWEILNRVSRQTGIVFPHHIQYLIEAYLLATRSPGKYAIYESTPHSLRFVVKGCPCTGTDVPCEVLCSSAFLSAGKESGVNLKISGTKSNGCEFNISPE